MCLAGHGVERASVLTCCSGGRKGPKPVTWVFPRPLRRKRSLLGLRVRGMISLRCPLNKLSTPVLSFRHSDRVIWGRNPPQRLCLFWIQLRRGETVAHVVPWAPVTRPRGSLHSGSVGPPPPTSHAGGRSGPSTMALLCTPRSLPAWASASESLSSQTLLFKSESGRAAATCDSVGSQSTAGRRWGSVDRRPCPWGRRVPRRSAASGAPRPPPGRRAAAAAVSCSAQREGSRLLLL